MPRQLYLAVAAFGLALSTAAHANTLFSQDFSNGLSANEQMGGRFQVSGGKAGHVDRGYGNNEFSYYDITLDLTHITSAQLQFDYHLFSEVRWDGFNVLASADDVFDWHDDLLLAENAGYLGMSDRLSHLGAYAFTGEGDGTLKFDLDRFTGQPVKVRIQFQSDGSNYSTGLQLDNVAVTGTYAPGYEPGPVGGPVPEPTTWAMMIIGFFGAGAFVRRERPVFA